MLKTSFVSSRRDASRKESHLPIDPYITASEVERLHHEHFCHNDNSLPLASSQSKMKEGQYQQFRIRAQPPGLYHPAETLIEPIRTQEHRGIDSSEGLQPPPYPENIVPHRTGLPILIEGGHTDDNIYEYPP